MTYDHRRMLLVIVWRRMWWERYVACLGVMIKIIVKLEEKGSLGRTRKDDIKGY